MRVKFQMAPDLVILGGPIEPAREEVCLAEAFQRRSGVPSNPGIDASPPYAVFTGLSSMCPVGGGG